jgi:hypothetical protein
MNNLVTITAEQSQVASPSSLSAETTTIGNPDAALIWIARQLIDDAAALERHDSGITRLSPDALAIVAKRHDAAFEPLAELRARTPEGLRAKAQAAHAGMRMIEEITLDAQLNLIRSALLDAARETSTSASLVTDETPLSSLNRRLRQITAEWEALDDAALEAYGTPNENAAQAAHDAKLKDLLAPRFEASKLQAITIKDAVIQATLGFYLLESVTPAEDDEADVHAVQTMLASIILGLARQGGIDLKDIAQGEMDEIAPMWVPGGRRAA